MQAHGEINRKNDCLYFEVGKIFGYAMEGTAKISLYELPERVSGFQFAPISLHDSTDFVTAFRANPLATLVVAQECTKHSRILVAGTDASAAYDAVHEVADAEKLKAIKPTGILVLTTTVFLSYLHKMQQMAEVGAYYGKELDYLFYLNFLCQGYNMPEIQAKAEAGKLYRVGLLKPE